MARTGPAFHVQQKGAATASCSAGASFEGAGGEQVHGLGDVSPGGGGAGAEPGRQDGDGLALAQVDQHEQGLLAGFSLRQRDPITRRCQAYDAGQVGERGTRNDSAAREKASEAPSEAPGK